MTRAVSMSASLESKSESPSSMTSSARAAAARARTSKYFMARGDRSAGACCYLAKIWNVVNT